MHNNILTHNVPIITKNDISQVQKDPVEIKEGNIYVNCKVASIKQQEFEFGIGIGPLMFDRTWDTTQNAWVKHIDSNYGHLTEKFLFSATIPFMEKPASERLLLDYHSWVRDEDGNLLYPTDPVGSIIYGLPLTVETAEDIGADIRGCGSSFLVGIRPNDPATFYADPNRELSVGFYNGGIVYEYMEIEVPNA